VQPQHLTSALVVFVPVPLLEQCGRHGVLGFSVCPCFLHPKCLWTEYFVYCVRGRNLPKFTMLVYYRTEMNWIDFEVTKLKTGVVKNGGGMRVEHSPPSSVMFCFAFTLYYMFSIPKRQRFSSRGIKQARWVIGGCRRNEIWHEDDAQTLVRCVAQRKRATPHSTMKNNCSIIECCNNAHQGALHQQTNEHLRFGPRWR